MTPPFDPTAPVIVDPPAVVRSDTSRAEQVVNHIIRLDRSQATNDFEMADLWVEIDDGDYWAADHCQSLNEFIKKHGFSLSPREITYRMNVSRKSAKIGVTREQRIKAGISKMKAICELNPDMEHTDPKTGNTEMLGDLMRRLVIEAGNGKSLTDVRERVSEVRGDPENELVYETVVYTRGQKATVDRAIEKAVALAGDTIDSDTGEQKEISRGSAYEIMAIEFNNDPNYQGDQLNEEPPSFEDESFVKDADGTLYETA